VIRMIDKVYAIIMKGTVAPMSVGTLDTSGGRDALSMMMTEMMEFLFYHKGLGKMDFLLTLI
jgi:hypothetical protein